MSDQHALDAAAMREVLALEADIYADPLSRHNVGHLLASEFWEVSASGEKAARETVLENIAASPLIVDVYPVDDTQVRIYGDVAISTGRSVLRGRIPSADGTEQPMVRANRFVHVWVRRDGVWQTVFAQNSNADES